MKGNTETFLEKVKNIEGYSFDKVDYKSAKTKVILTCNLHGDFSMTPNNFLNGQRCKVCSEEKRIKTFSDNYRKTKYIDLIQPEEYKLIPLGTEGKYAKVDNELFESLSKINWHFDGRYARAIIGGSKIRMHSYIKNPEAGQVVDHINRDELDNRLSNLRVCSHKENIRNSKPIKRTSEFKGVYFYKRLGRWSSSIVHEGNVYFIGNFDSEIEAAKAYDKKALELFGEFAYLNFPELKDEYKG